MAKENKEDTGKSFSEALILASTNPHCYDLDLNDIRAGISSDGHFDS